MNKQILLYIIVGILIVGLLIFTFFPNMIYVVKDSGKTGTDKCQPPEGQTQEAWEEHMSHHPDIYKGCL